MQVQVKADHYRFEKYIKKNRWISYWHQLDEVFRLSPESVLEIGCGAGVFKNIASNFEINIETVDIDLELKPDYVASVLDLPFQKNTYDVVVAFQVLEHLPYEQFAKALGEMRRVATHNIIISLPDADTLWRYVFYVPKLGEKNFYIKRPKLKKKDDNFNGEHYWEIGKKDYPLSRIIKEINDQGLKLIKTYRVPENPYHRFFILSKAER